MERGPFAVAARVVLAGAMLALTAETALATTITVGQGGGYDHSTIQAAIDAATAGDTVIVYPGTYRENIQFHGIHIVLRSADPTDAATVAATIIDGNEDGSVVTFAGTETDACVLAGFTIRNGSATGGKGHGICGLGTYARIEYNTITKNGPGFGDYRWGDGGGLYQCHGTIRNNTITHNQAYHAAGLYQCNGTIENNTIVGNRAFQYLAGSGGGLESCNGTIQDNTISDNSAYRGGALAYCRATIQRNRIIRNRTNDSYWNGVIYGCVGTIQNNVISDNSDGAISSCPGTIQNNSIVGNRGGGLRDCGGMIQNNSIESNTIRGLCDCDGTIQNNSIVGNEGIGLLACGGTIQNNVISWNSGIYGCGLYDCDGTIQNNLISDNWGGGMYSCRGTIRNNTIVGNSAYGLRLCTGTITNCIIWQNTPYEGQQLVDCSTPTYSCIVNWSGGGEGNINGPPRFTNGPLGGYYLSQIAAGQAVQSPCVDAGSTTALVLGLADRTTRTDRAADAGVVDIGYHYAIPPDLTGTLSQIGPTPIICGKPFDLAGHVENQAGGGYDEPVWVEFWAVRVPAGWTGYLCDSIRVGPLAVGEAFDLAGISPSRIAYHGIPGGLYTIEMRIDATDAVAELNEANNVARLEGVVILPDRPNLSVAGFDFFPQDINPEGGTMMTFSGLLHNTGSQPTTGSFWIEYRVWYTPNPDESVADFYLCDSHGIGVTLQPGESLDLATLPAHPTYALPPGVYYVRIYLDPLNQIAEQNENDNEVPQTRRKLYVGPRPTRSLRWRFYE